LRFIMTACPILPLVRIPFRAVAAGRSMGKCQLGVPAVLVAMSALLLGSPQAARAESNLQSGAAPALAASARLDFRITIPRVIFLRVGTGTDFASNPTVDAVDFNVPDNASGSGAAVAGQSSTAITARVVANGNNISFSAAGSTGGLTATSGAAGAVPWTEIVAASSGGSLPHPTIGNGGAGIASTLVASGGVVDQSSTWSFSYRNNTALAAGVYSGQVVYTAALP
jgi:hypothetical protein